MRSMFPARKSCHAAGELLAIFAAIVIWRMTEKWTIGLDGYRSSYAGQKEDKKEVRRGVGEICVVDVTGK
jgi:hypothetical protein